MNTKVTITNRYNILSAIAAFVLWGGWAFYINYLHSGFAIGFKSGLIQGIYSFCFTFAISFLVEKIFNAVQQTTLKLILPPLLIGLLTFCLLYLLHRMIATPSIAMTITPPLLIATVFAGITSFKLYHLYPKKQVE